MRRYIYIVLIAIIIVAAFFYMNSQNTGNIRDGYRVDTDKISSSTIPANEDLTDIIKVYYPRSGSKITSPLKVYGEARGQWYFEATFPIIIVNWDGLIIGEGYAEAKPLVGKDWMTTEFTPFEGIINFDKPENIKVGTYNERGAVIFKKSNPSDLPQNDAAVEIPIVFEE